MIKKLYAVLLFIIGGIIGSLLFCALQMKLKDISFNEVVVTSVADFSILVLFVIIFGLIFRIFAPALINKQKKAASYIEHDLKDVSIDAILIDAIGVVIGLVVALIISMSYRSLLPPLWYSVITITLYFVFGFFGFVVASAKVKGHRKILDSRALRSHEKINSGTPKVIDTSVIIDGRILDIMRAGFIDGKIIIPTFVLDELRHIADSSDNIKRVRGRRGLDILNQIRSEFNVEVYNNTAKLRHLDDAPEVDVKLIKLARELNANLITTDFNLNKVATINDIKVLNINELANAIKPVVIPGEKLLVDIVKHGKDREQGIGYLDDGTMIVVEDGAGHISESAFVTVTSVLQTSAGKMIFARINP